MMITLHRNSIQYLLCFILALFYADIVAQATYKPVDLRCEHLINPLGIDTFTPRLSWRIDDRRPGSRQIAYQLFIGTDSARLGEQSVWDSGKQEGSSTLVVYQGQALTPFTKYYWRVRSWNGSGQSSDSDIATFETGMMHVGNWRGAWISDSRDIHLKPSPYFRKEFNAKRSVKSACLYIAVAGLYELSINGKMIGNERLDPAYTRFDQRILYVTHDVTRYLANGQNAIGVQLGNGWFNHQSTAVWYFHEAPWRGRPLFCLDLRITYDDGSTEVVASGTDWKTALSPVIFNSIYTAEHYDARLEQKGWNMPGFDDSKWKNSIVRPAPTSNIVAQVMHPIRNVEKIPAKSVKQLNDTTWVFDLGRNIAGVIEFSASGTAGTVVRLKHGERLYPDGRVDISNIDPHYRPTDNSDPFQTDIFILSGNGRESFMPKFNYKGFQYIEVTCKENLKLAKEDLTGYFMHSDVPPVGRITSSNKLLEKIWFATNNSYLSNLFGYPTDCPQREKNGWTGDAHIAVETGLYNFDGITVYEKWMADHRDEQQPNGVLPAIIPTNGWGYHWANGPDWTSTIALIPWNLYLFYGDTHALKECYDHIKRYVDYIDYHYPTGLTTWGLGDWVPVKSKSPVELTSSLYYYADAKILASAAKLFAKEDDYAKYTALSSKIRDAINAKYLNKETGLYGTGLQTELSAPLYWGIVPEEFKSKVAANLAKRVEADNFHLDVGILGAKAILNALTENGYADVAYKLAAQDTYPSWGHWILNGATTLYENWNIKASNDISMNHIMFGEIGAWMFKGLGGIYPDPDKPGFTNTILAPNFVEGLNSFEAVHESRQGKIISSWSRKGKRVQYFASIPANTTATLKLRTGDKSKLYLEGKPIQPESSVGGIKTLTLASGEYRFEVR